MCLASFIYFAYGSNLLMKRIHINNPSATRIGIGKLKNYRLDFNYKSKRWHGASATIVPDSSSFVWGALWEIHIDHMKSLDQNVPKRLLYHRQEGVSANIYMPLILEVEMPSGNMVKCRTYQLVKLPPPLKLGETLPPDRQPSKVYLDTIIEGAEESGLPEDYIQKLRCIKDNGYVGPVYHDKD